VLGDAGEREKFGAGRRATGALGQGGERLEDELFIGLSFHKSSRVNGLDNVKGEVRRYANGCEKGGYGKKGRKTKTPRQNRGALFYRNRLAKPGYFVKYFYCRYIYVSKFTTVAARKTPEGDAAPRRGSAETRSAPDQKSQVR
jgi:hypothetical protein